MYDFITSAPASKLTFDLQGMQVGAGDGAHGSVEVRAQGPTRCTCRCCRGEEGRTRQGA